MQILVVSWVGWVGLIAVGAAWCWLWDDGTMMVSRVEKARATGGWRGASQGVLWLASRAGHPRAPLFPPGALIGPPGGSMAGRPGGWAKDGICIDTERRLGCWWRGSVVGARFPERHVATCKHQQPCWDEPATTHPQQSTSSPPPPSKHARPTRCRAARCCQQGPCAKCAAARRRCSRGGAAAPQSPRFDAARRRT